MGLVPPVKPMSNGAQEDPFHLAMLLTVIPPTLAKLPAAINAPS